MPYPIYHKNMSQIEFSTLAAKLRICLILKGGHALAASASAAYYYSQLAQKHFDWAGNTPESYGIIARNVHLLQLISHYFSAPRCEVRWEVGY